MRVVARLKLPQLQSEWSAAMNDSIGVPADSQGTTPITLALVVQNLEAADDALGRQHYDALTGILAQEIENLDVLRDLEPADSIEWETFDQSAFALDLIITMIEAGFDDGQVKWMIEDTTKRLVTCAFFELLDGAA